VIPISAISYFYYRNSVPYTENYMLSFQRQITGAALLTVSYAGNEGHHLLVTVPTNLGQSGIVPELEPAERSGAGEFHLRAFRRECRLCYRFGQDIPRNARGLRVELRTMNAQKTIGNSNYNALDATLRLAAGKRSTILVGYTYSKSIDDGSNLGEQINPINESLSRVISSWDMKHNFVASYNYALPFDRLFGSNRVTEGWSLSGTTRFSTGFPVTLFDDSDRSLLGTLGNGVNNQLLDTPQVLPGPLRIDTNPRYDRRECRAEKSPGIRRSGGGNREGGKGSPNWITIENIFQ
jgi:hypothetical protein